MTQQHPLTVEICREILPNTCVSSGSILHKAMQAAADWQLEQVVDAWCDALQEETECGVKFLSEYRAADMKRNYPVLARFGVVLEAMRPQQQ